MFELDQAHELENLVLQRQEHNAAQKRRENTDLLLENRRVALDALREEADSRYTFSMDAHLHLKTACSDARVISNLDQLLSGTLRDEMNSGFYQARDKLLLAEVLQNYAVDASPEVTVCISLSLFPFFI